MTLDLQEDYLIMVESKAEAIANLEFMRWNRDQNREGDTTKLCIAFPGLNDPWHMVDEDIRNAAWQGNCHISSSVLFHTTTRLEVDNNDDLCFLILNPGSKAEFLAKELQEKQEQYILELHHRLLQMFWKESELFPLGPIDMEEAYGCKVSCLRKKHYAHALSICGVVENYWHGLLVIDDIMSDCVDECFELKTSRFLQRTEGEKRYLVFPQDKHARWIDRGLVDGIIHNEHQTSDWLVSKCDCWLDVLYGSGGTYATCN